jgi:hypothetical protein
MNNQQLVETLNTCAATCHYCANACLGEDDIKMLTACIRLNMDCAEICTATATLLARNSEHGEHLLKECAEICGLCAAECEKHADHMDHCRICAEVCRSCEEACKEVEAE